MKPKFMYSPEPALEPKRGCAWADTMVLNPAIVKDPEDNTIHMLFRTTGPWAHKRMEGSPYDPYPIFFGYAKSDDLGKTWESDFSRPALAPALEYDMSKIYIVDNQGNKVPNFSNGCVEDPRIFQVEGELYLSAACRMFPPGPYWIEGSNVGMTHTNKPEWSKMEENPFGKAASKNVTVTVLFKLDLDKLKDKDYENAFAYVSNITDGNVDDNRDVFLFPEKMMVNGKLQYILIHRPHNPELFEAGKGVKNPSIMLAAAEDIRDFTTAKATHKLLAKQEFEWEEEKIGASWPPIKVNDSEWLLPYHGKQLPDYGYTQSFMILRNNENDFPEITHRCLERLMYAQQRWELPDKFLCPCLFTTGGIVIDDTLIMSYGAADQKAGISWVNFNDLVSYIKEFDANRNRISK
jgi:beta-1,2-mannobiose phosphorylase / 1,2-beta-oligomannan phosphorylase